jgi:chromosome segregation ATPase
MTGEEMERAIEFLLQSQAKVDAQLAETNQQLAETDRQLAETNRQLSVYAETQSVFIQTVTRALEAQDQINASLRAADARADARQAQTDERLNKLIALFEQHIVAGH